MEIAETDLPPVELSRHRSILEMSPNEAAAFFLKHESYCGFDLPPYFRFDGLLSNVNNVLLGHDISSLRSETPRNHDNVNHPILNNKDGRFAWRPLQLIHPALYVSLANQLTEQSKWTTICDRFRTFAELDRIKCLSLPVESLTDEKDTATQVANWWHEVEQRSIELALDYEYIAQADISDCYGSIYTHSIAWAIHEKSVAKQRENRNNQNLIGVVIDDRIQDMSYGQTNGIPQGSVLMDFVAEMVLGYADVELAKMIRGQGISDYLILRYRDDYRVFVNNPQDGERILKCLTEVMIELGLRLNAGKTKASNMVISDSVKPDKLSWIRKKHWDRRLQQHLLIIHSHSMEFPNTGSVAVALADYYRRLIGRETVPDPMPLISIVVDIAYRNPRTYSICSAILSKLLSFFETEEIQKNIVEKIVKRFTQIPNTGHMEIWLQRISRPFAQDIQFQEPLCQLAANNSTNITIWNNDWISSRDLRNALDPRQIFDQDIAMELDPVIPVEEVEFFASGVDFYR